MGSSNSKKRLSDVVVETDDNDGYFVKIELDNDIKRAEIEKLRSEYRNNIQIFLLNQVLFSVMFFKNYEQELIDMSPNEPNISVKELSLTDELFLTCLQPDEVLTLVNNHVYFCARHGPNKNKQSPLVMNRVFVIHESIQVVNDADYYYANIDKPSLTAQVVEEHRKGYVRLKYIEDLKFKNSVSSNTSSLTTSDDNSYEEKMDETYGRITEARTIKPMPLDKNQLSKTLYPISEVKRRNYDALDENDLYIYEYYVNSKCVKDQFHRKWQNIAQLLELDEEDIAKAGFNCDSIFCYSKQSKTMWEIIPAVQLPRGAYQNFIKVKTNAIEAHLARNKRKVFPNKEMLKNIASMDRLAIARGFMSKYDVQTNPHYHLEWELAHPKVEKYLQQWLTHTHMRVLLMMLLIHKSFIEPKTDTQGVTLRHLVTHLFWELQKDVVISETRMGTRLIQMIETFCKKLGKKELADYFVEQRNHFENIPFDKLLWAQKIFSRTRDKPLMNFMSALLNLQYMHDSYPEFDIKELYNILTMKNVLHRGKKAEKNTGRQDWATKRRTMILKQKQTSTENLTAERKGSVDSIDISIHVNRITESELEFLVRSRKILVFFLDHYLKMALSCNNVGNAKQGHSYLQQADLLTYLFHISCAKDAQDYRDKIIKHRNKILEGPIAEDSSLTGPTLPTRTSSIHIPTVRMVNRNPLDMGKVLQQHQTSTPRSGIFRKRHESEQSVENDDDPRDKTEEKVVRKKSVNFLSDVAPSQRTANDVTHAIDVIKPKEIGENKQMHQEEIRKENDKDDELDGLNEVKAEDDNDDGLDEIKTDSEEERETVFQITNPFDFKTNKINLQHYPDDSFT